MVVQQIYHYFNRHRKSRIQPNQNIFSQEHLREQVGLFKQIKKECVRGTLRFVQARNGHKQLIANKNITFGSVFSCLYFILLTMLIAVFCIY